MKYKRKLQTKHCIAVIGLGYVGLPLAIELGKIYKTFGFDINKKRIDDLRKGIDCTKEISKKEIFSSKRLLFVNKKNDLKIANIYIITVPTPVNKRNIPDLTYIREASLTVSRLINKGDIVIYESTVYPGLSEELAIDVIEKNSKLVFNKDFYVGYSPERINPGDKKNNIRKVLKVTSGSNTKTAKIVDNLYQSIIRAGTYKAKSIKVAEAAKVIENTQRDLNIALINELSIIFNKMNIDTMEVLKAAKTKWNFIPFEPGLVGGHCIGVDPYYLTYKSKAVGYIPNMILAGRTINDNMGKYVFQLLHQKILEGKKENAISKNNRNILIMGFSFKEDVPDVRNTKIIDIVKILKKNKYKVDVYDPVVDKKEVKNLYNLNIIKYPEKNKYVGIIVAVKHKEIIKIGKKRINLFKAKNAVVFDIKNILPHEISDVRL